jgi:isoleucyl-tRNA synthetase
MIAFRPDWCISRQRAWGVPIPALTCTSCLTPLLTKELTERAADVFENYPYGADAWYEGDLAQFVPAGLACPSCGGTGFERETNILDVWFDSGSSHEAVLPFYPELRWPADMYLEGSDQHRGWFHSSLLIGIGTRGRAPFNQVLTHGFTLDVEGEKMSKSRGNTILPEEIIRQSGADVLRLWVGTVDYREEVRVSREILSRIVESYRKLRNTCRILVANLYDFDPARDLVPLERMEEVDRYILGRYGEAARRMIAAYDEYDFPTVSKELSALATVDLSAFYVDVTKDRMYTYGAKSPARRSGQTAMFLMADGLARLMAPILPFTADELWRYMPGQRSESVHLETFPNADALADRDLQDRWARLMAVRDDVNAALEEQRKAKVIGNSLSAKVRIAARGAIGTLLEQYRAQLPTLFIVSDVALDVGAADAQDAVRVVVERAPGVKCERCWRYVPAVTTEPDRAGICDRCVEALAEPVNL